MSLRPWEKLVGVGSQDEDETETDDEGVDDEGGGDEEFEEPQQGDWVTSDHAVFFEFDGRSKPVLRLKGDESEREMWAAIDEKMKQDNFYPNVWFISDHGNAHLLRRPPGR